MADSKTLPSKTSSSSFLSEHFFRFLTFIYIYYILLHTEALLASTAFVQEPDPKFPQVQSSHPRQLL